MRVTSDGEVMADLDVAAGQGLDEGVVPGFRPPHDSDYRFCPACVKRYQLGQMCIYLMSSWIAAFATASSSAFPSGLARLH